MATGGNLLADSANTATPLYYVEGTFTPTVTLVGGAGNTVPVYTTNTGRYARIGRMVFVDVYLTGDGGDDGAGTGQVNIALPIAASASHPTAIVHVGTFTNGAATQDCFGQIAGAVSTVALTSGTFSAMTGADQNNVTRTIRLKFAYEV